MTSGPVFVIRYDIVQTFLVGMYCHVAVNLPITVLDAYHELEVQGIIYLCTSGVTLLVYSAVKGMQTYRMPCL